MRIHKSSAVGCEVRESSENEILESLPGRPSVGFCISVAVNKLVPSEDDIWLGLFLQFPRGGGADADVWCEIAFVFSADNNQVGIQMV